MTDTNRCRSGGSVSGLDIVRQLGEVRIWESGDHWFVASCGITVSVPGGPEDALLHLISVLAARVRSQSPLAL